MLDRFSRQKGLVIQEIVSNLRIFIEGLPIELNEALITLSEQLGIQNFPTSKEDAQFIIHGPNSSIKAGTDTISVSYGADGVFLDGRDSKQKIPSLFEPAIATVAGCLCLNEVLRRSNSFLPIEIPKASVSVNLRVDTNSMLGPLDELKFQIEGSKTKTNILQTDDGSGQQRILMRLDDDDFLAKQLIERLRISNGRIASEPAYPVMEFNLPNPQKTPRGHITLVGAGGLGTWVLKTMIQGLNKVELGNLEFLIFDGDMVIESHNLNRQVIYTEGDIGKPKAKAASDWLEQNLPNSNAKIAYCLKDHHLQRFETADLEHNDSVSLDDLMEANDSNSPITVLNDTKIQQQLMNTDVVLGCLDAMRPRTLADLIAAKMDQPYINAGVEGLDAIYREFKDSSLVSLFGKEIATTKSVTSCSSLDGDIPVSSIVLTNALVASFQAIAALQRLTGSNHATINTVRWQLRENDIFCIGNKNPVSRQGFVKDLESALWPESKSSIITDPVMLNDIIE